MKAKILFISTLVVLTTIYFLNGKTLDIKNSQGVQSKEQTLPQNPLNGRLVLENKGCINCHSVNGYGGKTAPDFGRHNFIGSEYDLISNMWDHSPEMFKQMDAKNTAKQELSSEDFRSLRYFLNYLRYLGNSGNVTKGKELFAKMKCNECHSIDQVSPHMISLNKMGIYASPVYLAQVMWNHAAKMQKMQKQSGIKVPLFKGDEFSDLSSYIQSVNSNGKKEKIYMSPGNPLKGEKLFKSKKCFYCHEQSHIGPDLTKYNFNKSVTEIAGMMWNHSSSMQSEMTKNKIVYPVFKNDEMANLISYLYFRNQAQVKGSAEEGKKLFLQKGCISCHSKGNSYNAPAVSSIGPFHNSDSFFSDLWNHLPLMEKGLYAKGQSLPKLLPSEIKSLYLYFRTNGKTGI